jgi:hypothetical protein
MLRLEIDETGHFAGTVVPNSVELEGTFVAPNRVKGKIIGLETEYTSHCTRVVVPFTAQPR